MKLSRLPAKYGALLTPLILSIIMTFIVSLIATVKAVGISDFSAREWMSAWCLSWMVAFPTLLLVLPLVRRIVGLLVAPHRA
jgi:ABC-type phosphate/phosphonate transport system permease subunit